MRYKVCVRVRVCEGERECKRDSEWPSLRRGRMERLVCVNEGHSVREKLEECVCVCEREMVRESKVEWCVSTSVK